MSNVEHLSYIDWTQFLTNKQSVAYHFDYADNHFEESSIIPDSAFELYKGDQNIANTPKVLTAQSISALSKTLSSDIQQTHRPMSIADSDVFDGISEIASSINLSFEVVKLILPTQYIF